jgi:BirA family biotin operon repressor/biotin-[acetyl-CoA-carboxylase] ligase
VTLAQALHPELRIKWPNDLWWQQRKLAGILIETAHAGQQRLAVIGVGINVKMPAAQDLATPAAALSEILPDLDPIAVLDRLLLPLARALRQFETQGFAPFATEFARLDGLHGRPVRLSDGSQGVAAGVGAQGALLVHTDAGILEVTSSEVSVRPV